jgi:hypothetical protein
LGITKWRTPEPSKSAAKRYAGIGLAICCSSGGGEVMVT